MLSRTYHRIRSAKSPLNCDRLICRIVAFDVPPSVWWFGLNTIHHTIFDKYLCYLFSFGIVRFRLAPYPISVPTTTVIRPVPFFRIPCAPYQSNPAAKIADFWMHTTCRFNKSVHNVLNQTKLDDRCIDHRRDRGIFVDQ